MVKRIPNNGNNNQARQTKKSVTKLRTSLNRQNNQLRSQVNQLARRVKVKAQNRAAADKRVGQTTFRPGGSLVRGSGQSEAVANYMASVLDPCNAPVPSRIPNDFPKESALKRFNFNGTFDANAEGNFAVTWRPWDLVGGLKIFNDDSLVPGTMTQDQPATSPAEAQITSKFKREFWSHAVLVGACLRVKSNGPSGSTQGYMVCSNMPVLTPSDSQAFTENNMRSIGLTERFEPYEKPEIIYYPRDPNDICFRTKAEFDDAQDLSECILTAAGYGVVNALTDRPVQLEYEMCIIVEYVPELGFEMAEIGRAAVDSRAVSAMSILASKRKNFAVASAEPNGGWISKVVDTVRDMASSTPSTAIGSIVHSLWDTGVLPTLGRAAMALI